MKCDICSRPINWPDKFHSTAPLISRKFCCDECYLTWVVPYKEKELKKVPDSIVWFSNAYYAEDRSRRK